MCFYASFALDYEPSVFAAATAHADTSTNGVAPAGPLHSPPNLARKSARPPTSYTLNLDPATLSAATTARPITSSRPAQRRDRRRSVPALQESQHLPHSADTDPLPRLKRDGATPPPLRVARSPTFVSLPNTTVFESVGEVFAFTGSASLYFHLPLRAIADQLNAIPAALQFLRQRGEEGHMQEHKLTNWYRGYEHHTFNRRNTLLLAANQLRDKAEVPLWEIQQLIRLLVSANPDEESLHTPRKWSNGPFAATSLVPGHVGPINRVRWALYKNRNRRALPLVAVAWPLITTFSSTILSSAFKVGLIGAGSYLSIKELIDTFSGWTASSPTWTPPSPDAAFAARNTNSTYQLAGWATTSLNDLLQEAQLTRRFTNSTGTGAKRYGADYHWSELINQIDSNIDAIQQLSNDFFAAASALSDRRLPPKFLLWFEVAGALDALRINMRQKGFRIMIRHQLDLLQLPCDWLIRQGELIAAVRIPVADVTAPMDLFRLVPFPLLPAQDSQIALFIEPERRILAVDASNAHNPRFFEMSEAAFSECSRHADHTICDQRYLVSSHAASSCLFALYTRNATALHQLCPTALGLAEPTATPLSDNEVLLYTPTPERVIVSCEHHLQDLEQQASLVGVTKARVPIGCHLQAGSFFYRSTKAANPRPLMDVLYSWPVGVGNDIPGFSRDTLPALESAVRRERARGIHRVPVAEAAALIHQQQQRPHADLRLDDHLLAASTDDPHTLVLVNAFTIVAFILGACLFGCIRLIQRAVASDKTTEVKERPADNRRFRRRPSLPLTETTASLLESLDAGPTETPPSMPPIQLASFRTTAAVTAASRRTVGTSEGMK